MATAFAVFCATDGSLTFYNRDTVPAVGDTFEGKIVSNVYTGFESTSYTYNTMPWYDNITNIISVDFAEEFATVKPVSTTCWFYNASNMQSFNGNNFDTSNVTDMSSMFYSCSNLTVLKTSNFITSKVTNMYYMFGLCKKLTSLKLTNFDTSKVTNMGSMFAQCLNLTTLKLNSFDTSKVTKMSYMFSYCENLTTIYVSDLWNTTSVTNSKGMFNACNSIVGAVPFDNTKEDASMANYETGYFTYKRYVKPEDMLIKNTTLYNIADEIRILYGTEDTMTPAVMTNQLGNANTEVDEQTDLIKRIKIELGLIMIGRLPTEWTQSNVTSGTFNDIYYANGLWVACSTTGLYYSIDGKTWTQSNVTSGDFHCVRNANGIWVACGPYTSGKLWYSADGMNWTQSTLNKGIFTVRYADGLWVAGGNGGGLFYSNDGINWTQSNITSPGYTSVHYADGLWVAASNGTSTNLLMGLFYSNDGINWTQSNITDVKFECICYADGLWVAGGADGALFYSNDGINWTHNYNKTYKIFSLLHANGTWVAGTQNGGLYYSYDGINWAWGGVGGSFNAIYNSNGVWAVAYNVPYYSIDGKAWSQSNNTNVFFESVYYANGLWVAGSTTGIYYSEGIPVEIETT